MTDWILSIVLLLIFVASIGVIVALPASWQMPYLWVIPIIVFIFFLNALR